jgi:hypothetical protein
MGTRMRGERRVPTEGEEAGLSEVRLRLGCFQTWDRPLRTDARIFKGRATSPPKCLVPKRRRNQASHPTFVLAGVRVRRPSSRSSETPGCASQSMSDEAAAHAAGEPIGRSSSPTPRTSSQRSRLTTEADHRRRNVGAMNAVATVPQAAIRKAQQGEVAGR